MPDGCPRVEAISLTLEELEAVRLVDLLDLDQDDAAFYMGVSRKAFWNDLMNARKKIATALVYGMGLRIEGGSYALRGGEEIQQEQAADEPRKKELALMDLEISHLQSRLESLRARMSVLRATDAQDARAEVGPD